MITAILEITRQYLHQDYSAWIYLLTVITDFAIISRIGTNND